MATVEHFPHHLSVVVVLLLTLQLLLHLPYLELLLNGLSQDSLALQFSLLFGTLGCLGLSLLLLLEVLRKRSSHEHKILRQVTELIPVSDLLTLASLLLFVYLLEAALRHGIRVRQKPV